MVVGLLSHYPLIRSEGRCPLSLAIPFRDSFVSSLHLLASFTLLASLIVRSLSFFLLALCFLGSLKVRWVERIELYRILSL